MPDVNKRPISITDQLLLIAGAVVGGVCLLAFFNRLSSIGFERSTGSLMFALVNFAISFSAFRRLRKAKEDWMRANFPASEKGP